MWPCGLLKRNVSLHLRRSIRRFINTSEHDNICVIGAGPSGMLFSSLLSQFKIPHTLIDRRTSPTSHPQAHFINARSMEILRDWTPEVFNRIIRESPPSSSWRYVLNQ